MANGRGEDMGGAHRARMKSWEMNIHRGRQPGRIKKKGMGSGDREVTSREGCEAGLPGSY